MAAEWEQEHYAAVDKERLESLKAAGVTITQLDTAPFREAAKKVYAEHLTSDAEKKILKMIQDIE